MSFDDRIRQSLNSAAATHEPGPPPVSQLGTNVRRRQRAKAVGTGLAGAAAVVLLLGIATLPDRSSSQDTLTAADRGSRSLSSSENGTNDKGGNGGSSSTETTRRTSASTAAAGATIAPTGTVYAPPASVVYPPSTTTTIRGATTTTSPPADGDTVTVTQDDNGKTVTLRRGQHLVVTLDDSAWEWSSPDTDSASVLERTAVSANPSSTHVTAAFDAKSAGQAHVSASKDAPCRRAQPPCMVPTYLWQITVNVV